MENIKLGFVLTGSFCTFKKAFEVMEGLKKRGADITAIFSYNAYSIDSRFGSAKEFIKKAEDITGKDVIHTLEGAEPIGPLQLFDLLMVLPCTGNTLAKLALGIYDTPACLAVKSHLRNEKPVLIGVSSNDSLKGAGKNIGQLMNYKNYYFIPMRQDDYEKKPYSVVCDFSKAYEAIEFALKGKQLQPMLL